MLVVGDLFELHDICIRIIKRIASMASNAPHIAHPYHLPSVEGMLLGQRSSGDNTTLRDGQGLNSRSDLRSRKLILKS